MDGSLASVGLEQLLQAVGAGSGRSLAVAETLPPAAYTDRAFYDLEVEKLLKRDWICVGHISQLAQVGDYFPLDLFGELLVVVRAEDAVRVMSRVCLHRWAPLVSAPGNTKVLSCPFHKWGFALDGRLLGAPLMEQVEFEPDSCRLPQYPTEIVDGFIYMSFNQSARSLAPQLAEMSQRLAHFSMDELVIAATLEYDCAFNWKIAVETFMECYHHIAAHPETFERAFPARMSYGEDARTMWTAVHAPVRAEMRDTATTAGFPLLGDLSEAELGEFCLYQVFPFHLINVLPDRIYWFRMQPDGPGRTRLQTSYLVRPEARALPDYEALVAAETDFMDKVNIEDISVNDMQQVGAASPSAVPGRLSHLEKAVWQLADYVREGVRA
jgi:phenylpropionate dioxygenase-like ring-hydroxylating dioxygenase large terminal subunit